MERIINQSITDTEFSGQGMLDFEEWFVIWEMNHKDKKEELYKILSIDLAERQHPELAPGKCRNPTNRQRRFYQSCQVYYMQLNRSLSRSNHLSAVQ